MITYNYYYSKNPFPIKSIEKQHVCIAFLCLEFFKRKDYFSFHNTHKNLHFYRLR